MIIVTGATGQLGRLIVEKLAERIPANRLGVRDASKAADLAPLGIRVRQGDFGDPDSLRHAFEGATQILIASSNARASGGDPLAHHRNAIDAAKAVGARRIVYTSHMAASATSASRRRETTRRRRRCWRRQGSRGLRCATASAPRAGS